jgi:uncharacterized iron-regulated protein
VIRALFTAALLSPLPLVAGFGVSAAAEDAPRVAADWQEAEIAVLGEIHDNPAHHEAQAEIVAAIAPKALVFEMLTPDQAAAHVPGADAETLASAFGWAESGWPDFSYYHPIFAAAPDAQVFGAGVPRARAGEVMEAGLSAAFGAGAAGYGLDAPLPDDEQAAREAYQMAAHCDALPEHLLPMMVDMQRLRDAELARQTVRALEATGGPVAVITGNGHAREDWGMPVYLARVLPEAAVVTLGQGEDGRPPDGVFDIARDAPPAERPDPCAAFR